MTPDTLSRLARDPAAFRASLRLDTGRPWRLDQWQDEFFRATDPGWQRAIGRDVPGGHSRAWAIRPRGHSKTHDIATMIAWALLAAPRERPARGVVAAGDTDQARLVGDGVRRIVRANDWLAGYIDVQRGRVVNPHTESEAVILASDAPTSMGLLVDFIICDELTVWRSRDLWDALFSAAAKQPHVFLAVLGNAGFIGTWQHELWATLSADEAWHCHQLPGPVASWISPTALAEQRRILPPAVDQRYWGNQWVPETGDGIPPHVLDRAITQEAIPWNLPPGVVAIVAAIDIGLKRDATGLAICGVDQHTRRVVTLHTQSWHPAPGQEVSLSEIESAVYHLAGQFRCREWVFDSWQAAGLRQRVANMGLDARDIAPTAANLDAIAQTVFHGFQEGCFQIPAGMFELIADLRKLSIIERPGVGNTAFRLVAPRDSTGHADIASAWCMAATQAQIYSRSIGRSQPVTAGNYFDDYPSVNGIPPGGKPLPLGYANDLTRDGYNPATAHRISLDRLPLRPYP